MAVAALPREELTPPTTVEQASEVFRFGDGGSHDKRTTQEIPVERRTSGACLGHDQRTGRRIGGADCRTGSAS